MFSRFSSFLAAETPSGTQHNEQGRKTILPLFDPPRSSALNVTILGEQKVREISRCPLSSLQHYAFKNITREEKMIHLEVSLPRSFTLNAKIFQRQKLLKIIHCSLSSPRQYAFRNITNRDTELSISSFFFLVSSPSTSQYLARSAAVILLFTVAQRPQEHDEQRHKIHPSVSLPRSLALNASILREQTHGRRLTSEDRPSLVSG